MIPAPRKLKQENCKKFEASLSFSWQDLTLTQAPKYRQGDEKEEKKRREGENGKVGRKEASL